MEKSWVLDEDILESSLRYENFGVVNERNLGRIKKVEKGEIIAG
jgi:hypothetical protein